MPKPALERDTPPLVSPHLEAVDHWERDIVVPAYHDHLARATHPALLAIQLGRAWLAE
jgi:hypothetical protein